MPPSTWMQSRALHLAASMPTAAATAAAMDSCAASSSATALAASAAATAVCCARSSISAHMCLTAWKLPIGLPNCSRTFAYSVAVLSVQRASPAASAASTVAVRSTIRWLVSGSTVAAAEASSTRASGREKSVALSASTVTPSAVASTSNHWAPSAPAGSNNSPSASPPSTNSAVPVAIPEAASKAMLDVSATPAVRSPEASASSSCSSVITSVASAVVATGPGISAAAASSTIAQSSSAVPPAPPSCSGTATPNIPSCANPA